jgi:hypothetical protein
VCIEHAFHSSASVHFQAHSSDPSETRGASGAHNNVSTPTKRKHTTRGGGPLNTCADARTDVESGIGCVRVPQDTDNKRLLQGVVDLLGGKVKRSYKSTSLLEEFITPIWKMQSRASFHSQPVAPLDAASLLRSLLDSPRALSFPIL